MSMTSSSQQGSVWIESKRFKTHQLCCKRSQRERVFLRSLLLIIQSSRTWLPLTLLVVLQICGESIFSFSNDHWSISITVWHLAKLYDAIMICVFSFFFFLRAVFYDELHLPVLNCIHSARQYHYQLHAESAVKKKKKKSQLFLHLYGSLQFV